MFLVLESCVHHDPQDLDVVSGYHRLPLDGEWLMGYCTVMFKISFSRVYRIQSNLCIVQPVAKSLLSGFGFLDAGILYSSSRYEEILTRTDHGDDHEKPAGGAEPPACKPPTRRQSPAPEAANPAILPEPEHPYVEDIFLAEDDSHDEDNSHIEDDSHDEDYFLVSITYDYSTITARARSFQGVVLTGVTPLQLAQNGFYYRPSGVSNAACCFACQSTKHLSTFQCTPFEEVQQLHEEDCIWQIISCDLKHHLGTPNKPPSSITAFPSPKRSTPTANSSTQTTDDSGIKSRTQSTPNTSTTAKERSNTNFDCRSNPLPATTDPEPQRPRPTCSPQPLQPTPNIISSPHSQQLTYASILQHPTTSSPQSSPKPDEPIPPAKPALTIEDLHRRFHNKPSPFQLENKTSRRSIKRLRKTASATQSLSRFLASALPAFARFLTETQSNPDTCYPSPPQFHYSRAMRAA
ncbi:hypothetical protein N7451_012761 [Penicillium sp. IBT 35674x]|nr:hypothetical protein N7451_012761 [Penicillium sp. IBT 35674x]